LGNNRVNIARLLLSHDAQTKNAGLLNTDFTGRFRRFKEIAEITARNFFHYTD
jgi:hypothetical protein